VTIDGFGDTDALRFQSADLLNLLITPSGKDAIVTDSAHPGDSIRLVNFLATHVTDRIGLAT
jgi:hypothetical protein